MTITNAIGDFDPETRTVPVTFTMAGEDYSRQVNACLTAAGDYDAPATALRVQEVARGLPAKVAAGAVATDASIAEAAAAAEALADITDDHSDNETPPET